MASTADGRLYSAAVTETISTGAPSRTGPGLSVFRATVTGGSTALDTQGTPHMVIVMAPDATSDNIDALVELVSSAGGEAYVTRGVRSEERRVGKGGRGRWRVESDREREKE